MAWFKRKEEIREDPITAEQLLLQALLGITVIDRKTIMEIPTVSACINLISGMIAGIPINLYKENAGKVEPIKNDVRVLLLNDYTNDVLDGTQLKEKLVKDYLINGNAYCYINKDGNKCKSLNYIDLADIAILPGTNPIFKSSKLQVGGNIYEHYNFITLTQNSKDGVSGSGILQNNAQMLSLAYAQLKFENSNVSSGGIKKGVIKSDKKLSTEALAALKAAWANLYGKDSKENCIILNDGLDYKELQQTSVEMQLMEHKKINSEELSKLLMVAPSILDGTATDVVFNNFIKTTIMPILIKIQSALNKSLLLETEKSSYYFAFDTKEIMRANILDRYKAYGEAVKAGWITKNEIRYNEDIPAIGGLDIVTMSLGEVIYDTKSKTFFVPNTDSKVGTGFKEGGD